MRELSQAKSKQVQVPERQVKQLLSEEGWRMEDDSSQGQLVQTETNGQGNIQLVHPPHEVDAQQARGMWTWQTTSKPGPSEHPTAEQAAKHSELGHLWWTFSPPDRVISCGISVHPSMAVHGKVHHDFSHSSHLHTYLLHDLLPPLPFPLEILLLSWTLSSKPMPKTLPPTPKAHTCNTNKQTGEKKRRHEKMKSKERKLPILTYQLAWVTFWVGFCI